MRLYHGSNTAFREVDLSLCRPNKDFGQGFYLAPDRIAAERMAKRTVRLVKEWLAQHKNELEEMWRTQRIVQLPPL